MGTAGPREILRPPLNVKDPVGSSATDRGKDAITSIHRVQVVPVWEDRVAVDGGRGQAFIAVSCAVGHELGIAVGRQIDAGEGLVVQGERER